MPRECTDLMYFFQGDQRTPFTIKSVANACIWRPVATLTDEEKAIFFTPKASGVS